jgi:hypothetical protein
VVACSHTLGNDGSCLSVRCVSRYPKETSRAHVQMWVAVEELLRRGASLSEADSEGRTPLDVAVQTAGMYRTGESSGECIAHETMSDEEKVAYVKNSRLYTMLTAGRQLLVDVFLDACAVK